MHQIYLFTLDIIEYVQLKTRGKQEQMPLFGMKICTDIRQRALFVLE